LTYTVSAPDGDGDAHATTTLNADRAQSEVSGLD
jgi:hypothetical protein